MMKKTFGLLNILFLFYVTAVSGLILGCGKGEAEKTMGSPDPIKAEKQKPDYKTIKIGLQSITDEVRAVGTVLAYQEVQISSEISGRIRKIHFDVGDSIKESDLLAEIDEESRLISVQKKRALLKRAEVAGKKSFKDAQKGSKLFKEGVISDSESDDFLLDRQIADAELDLARAELLAAEKELRDTKIRAPFDGKIALKNVELGKLVTPGQSFFTLVDIKRVKIIINISELDIAKISAGSPAEVVLDSLSGETFSGKVETVGLKADDSTRTFPVEIVVLNDKEKLLPGMVARVTVKSKAPRKAIVIPRAALRTVKGTRVAYVMSNGQIEQRRVYLGTETEERVVVEKGLAEGEQLIVSGIDNNPP
jgi:RND family efflux transporter MFP subunit